MASRPARILLGAALLAACFGGPALAFPPYETTDAETAGARAIEFRLGLVEVEERGADRERLAPLSNLNFGVGPHFEISSELEYAYDDGELAEAPVGFKWAAARGVVAIGVETFALLPVQSDQAGAGIESQFLTTFARERWQIHGNAGFFYDPRRAETERGWRASALAEFPREKLRPGVELFGREAHGEPAAVELGAGLIATFPRTLLHAGVHVGLTDAAPDWEANLWLSWKWQRTGDE